MKKKYIKILDSSFNYRPDFYSKLEVCSFQVLMKSDFKIKFNEQYLSCFYESVYDVSRCTPCLDDNIKTAYTDIEL